ncbi:hypothetical protein [Spartinivicinus ruber]|uniref:hypothetical protein n=1 Tax=Spartinivicinus ruber TaxID=2683272 RepID=UPI0013D0D72C|nr:hypothetical protein [Spartinivicinus ruber]
MLKHLLISLLILSTSAIAQFKVPKDAPTEKWELTGSNMLPNLNNIQPGDNLYSLKTPKMCLGDDGELLLIKQTSIYKSSSDNYTSFKLSVLKDNKVSIDGLTEGDVEAGFGLPFIRLLRALEYCSAKEFSGEIKIPDYFKVESIYGYTSYEELAAASKEAGNFLYFLPYLPPYEFDPGIEAEPIDLINFSVDGVNHAIFGNSYELPFETVE